QRLYIETTRRVKKRAEQIAKELNITGPFNIQFLAHKNKIQVIECNLRASRSFPFCSKVFKQNMIEIATKAILDQKIKKVDKSSLDLDHVGVKAPQFSFSRLKGADPISGVEMASTGEVGCIGHELNDAFLKAMLSVGFVIPEKSIFFSADVIEDRVDFLDSFKKLKKLGFTLFSSEETLLFMKEKGIEVKELYLPLQNRTPNVLDYIKEHRIDLVINIPKNNSDIESKNDYLIRRTAVDFEIPLITNLQIAKRMTDALEYYKQKGLDILSWEEY
ncbi:MAG: ATP-grasp domain-containing protein, partial [Candidatus Pacebacteria bacterium]|nr:ATP-grasp domain-containing protein [Candidatus Paceibacterota bacterium]